MKKIIQKSLPHIGAFAVFFFLGALFFYPQFQGKVLQQGDIMQYRGMSQEVRAWKEKTGHESLWTNSMFGGMPTYQINTISKGNALKSVDVIFRKFMGDPLARFLMAMTGFYILMILLGADVWLAAVSAIAFGFMTNNVILYEAGHETKLKVITYLPFMAAGLLTAFRGRYLMGGMLFALGMGLAIVANHLQMLYYFFLTLPFLGIAQFIYDFKKGRLPAFFKAAGALLIGGVLALGAGASNLWVTYEYSKDTMRGKPILSQAADPSSSSATEGLAWDYAMQWSNGWIDVFSSFIPGLAGGSGSEKVGPESATMKSLRRMGARLPANWGPPLYWGDLPFTSGPIYMGIIVLLLFLFGLQVVEGPVKWWIGLSTLLLFLLSMGKNLEGINRFFFEYVPLYNKFRTPNSILSIATFLMPLLGALGLLQLFRGAISKERALKALYVAAGISGGMALFFALIGPSVFSFESNGDAQYAQMGLDVKALIQDRKALMRSDAWRSFALVVLSAGLLWTYLQGYIKRNFALVGLGLLVLVDFWGVDRRYLSPEDFKPKRIQQEVFPLREADKTILTDKTLHYRVYDLTENTFNSTRTSYYHKSLGGYHAAKLQRYQDIIDRYLSRNFPPVISMLNARYLIVKGPDGKPQAQRNPDALGNAWFVDSIAWVNTPDEEIAALEQLDLSRQAAVHREFQEQLKGFQPGNIRDGHILLLEYAPDKLKYEFVSNDEQLVVFSEIWYGPNKGWKAYIDGQPAEIIRANYLLRAMRVPAGEHTIEMVFEPDNYYKGVMISRVFSGIILIGLLGMIGMGLWKLYFTEEEEEAQKPKKIAKTKVRKRRK